MGRHVGEPLQVLVRSAQVLGVHPQRLLGPEPLGVIDDIALGPDEGPGVVEEPDDVLDHMDMGAVASLAEPLVVLELSVPPEAGKHGLAIPWVGVRLVDLRREGLLDRGEAEHPDKCRVAVQDPAVGGGDEVAGDIVHEEEAVLRLALPQRGLGLLAGGEVVDDAGGDNFAPGVVAEGGQLHRNASPVPPPSEDLSRCPGGLLKDGVPPLEQDEGREGAAHGLVARNPEDLLGRPVPEDHQPAGVEDHDGVGGPLDELPVHGLRVVEERGEHRLYRGVPG